MPLTTSLSRSTVTLSRQATAWRVGPLTPLGDNRDSYRNELNAPRPCMCLLGQSGVERSCVGRQDLRCRRVGPGHQVGANEVRLTKWPSALGCGVNPESPMAQVVARPGRTTLYIES